VLQYNSKKIYNRIDDLLRKNIRVIFAIEGRCASGKTTLAKQMQKKYEGNLFHMDDFFLQPVQRTPARLAEPGGNVDYERFYIQVLTPLTRGECFSYRPYDCGTLAMGKEINVNAHPVNIIEGTYSMHPTLQPAYNGKIFLSVDKNTQLKRLKERSPHLLDRFIGEWIPMEEMYHSTFNIKGMCDFIL
jgi:uridine kinase